MNGLARVVLVAERCKNNNATVPEKESHAGTAAFPKGKGVTLQKF
jgi:hypothetical protein